MSETATTTELVCPDCGKTFTRAASLGAHRKRAHGVGGTSRTPRRARATSSRRPRSSSSNGGERHVVDHDRLLALVFPDGLPKREATLHAAIAWLAEADRLARSR